jgi:hypothetical protein
VLLAIAGGWPGRRDFVSELGPPLGIVVSGRLGLLPRLPAGRSVEAPRRGSSRWNAALSSSNTSYSELAARCDDRTRPQTHDRSLSEIESRPVDRPSRDSGRDALLTRVPRNKVTVTAASFTVAVKTLKSDRSMRDQRIHTIGLQSEQYPKATFVLSSPIALPKGALDGRVIHASATGVFDIHGTSKRETVPLQMRLSDSALETVGSLTFP